MQAPPYCRSRREYLVQCWKAAKQNWIVATVAFISAAYSVFTTVEPLVDIKPFPIPALPKLPLTWAAIIALAAITFVAIEGGYRLRQADMEAANTISDADKRELEQIELELASYSDVYRPQGVGARDSRPPQPEDVQQKVRVLEAKRSRLLRRKKP